MQYLYLQRFAHLTDGTFGRLVLPKGPTLYTVERPWANNEVRISCIPEGIYNLKLRESPMVERSSGGAHKKGWEVADVPNRTFIMLHPANWAEQLMGCIAVGTRFKVMKNPSGTNEHGVIQSRAAFNVLMDAMDPDDEWRLNITTFYSQL